jgi:hypothetical protein
MLHVFIAILIDLGLFISSELNIIKGDNENSKRR